MPKVQLSGRDTNTAHTVSAGRSLTTDCSGYVYALDRWHKLRAVSTLWLRLIARRHSGRLRVAKGPKFHDFGMGRSMIGFQALNGFFKQPQALR
ncbi:MAG: hypothetical protein DWQ31_13005, partial [Planctomycetota bacterium]